MLTLPTGCTTHSPLASSRLPGTKSEFALGRKVSDRKLKAWQATSISCPLPSSSASSQSLLFADGLDGLANSMVFIPIVSVGALQPMMRLGDGRPPTSPDHTLVEWMAALELVQRGKLRAVLPLIVAAKANVVSLSPVSRFSAKPTEDKLKSVFDGVGLLPDTQHTPSMEKVAALLEETTGDRSTAKLEAMVEQATGKADPTVHRVIATLLR